MNLPRKDKFLAPRYQELKSTRLPVATSDDGLATVKVIAGEALGVKAAIETRTPIVYQHWSLQPGAKVEQLLQRAFKGFVYVFKGAVKVGGREVKDGEAGMLGEGDVVSLEATQPTELLLLAGVPLEEPMVRWGPFVMNTRSELIQAAEDFQNGRMGQIQR